MKASDVKIGMKVVPFRKTAGWGNLESSHQWEEAQERGNNFMYVVTFDKEEDAYGLSSKSKKSNHHWDFFRASDFRPYKGDNNAKNKSKSKK